MKYVPNDFTDEQCKEVLISAARNGIIPFEVTSQTKVARFCEGGQSIPLNINDEFVVRFPKDSNGNGQLVLAEMKRESDICDILAQQNFSTPISKVKIVENETYPFAYHPIIKGKTMDPLTQKNNVQYNNLTETQKTLLAQDLAKFLNQIHSINPSEIANLHDYKSRDDKNEFKTRKKALLKFGILLDNFYRPEKNDIVFCHNDLHGRNLAIEENKQQVLAGIFDFGMAGLNERSADFSKLCTIDRNLARRTINEYNIISLQKADMKDVDYKFLCWNADSLNMIANLPEKVKENFERVSSAYLKNFRKDVLAEKLEERTQKPYNQPQKPNSCENNKLSQEVLDYYKGIIKNSKRV